MYGRSIPDRTYPLPDPTTRFAAALAGRYRVEPELGRGGMAVVYRGYDLRHQRPVALKVLRAELAVSVGAERFLREIRFAARLQHPHILPLLDSGEVPAEPTAPPILWYAMPLVEGESLRERLRRQGQQPLGEALRWTAELADALAYAHAHGIVHRDIKPENVLLTAAGDGGHALLADFGVARALEPLGSDRLTESGLALGTPTYMSPEQSLGSGAVDARSDLYSLGCVLYELLVGEPPYTGPTAQAIVAKRLTDPVPSVRRLRETVPPEVDAILERLLAKSPADRYATAGELSAPLAAALAAVPASHGGTAAAVGPRVPTRQFPPQPPPVAAGSGRLRRVVLLAIALLIAAAGVLVARRVIGGGARSPAELDLNAVAVLPFRITAPDPSLDYLGEGIVDLLAVKLDGSAGPRAVPARQLLAALRYQPGMAIPPDVADAAARRTGAGRVLDGTLVRSGAGIELSASLRRTDGGGRPVHASATGSLDSLPVLVDRLAAQLLASEDEVLPVLGELSSARAIAAYLRGTAADRRGRYQEAAADLGEALAEDSTFALAALAQISVANRFNDLEVVDRAKRLAWTYRGRLGPKGRLLLRGLAGPKYPEVSSLIAQIAALQDAVNAAPEVPDAWFELGDIQLHDGGLNDVPNAIGRAEASFERALELAPEWVLPLDHQLMAKLWLDDTTGFRALARRWVAEDTVPGDRSPYIRWRLGVALGDSAEVARQRASLDRWSEDALVWLAGDAQADAVGLGDVELAIRELEHRAVTGPKLWDAREHRLEFLLNTGRPTVALALTDSLASGEPYPGWAKVTRIENALYWDGDTAAAAADVVALSAADRRRSRTSPPAGAEVRAHCRLGLWALHHGDAALVRTWSSRLHGEQTKPDQAFNDDDRAACAVLLDAWLAWHGADAPEARRLLDRADSLYIASDVMDDWVLTNLVTAHLREAAGDLPGAARAIRRVRVALPVSPTYWSTYLREGARIKVEAGDTAEAVRDLRRFLVLRGGAEPALRAEVDSARARLAQLVAR
jgi:tetratricopeptide (TPR) repeat protein